MSKKVTIIAVVKQKGGTGKNTTDVRNIKQYLLASIYNAPYTISAHYDAKVRHDMASGKLGGRW